MMKKNTTLCYIEKGGQVLMLHRIKKQQDINAGKWIGVGGKFEEGESPEDCLLREVYEETGLTLTEYAYRGIVTFVSDEYGTEYMHLFTATAFKGEPRLGEGEEGVLKWVPGDQVLSLNLWEGDRAFLTLLRDNAPFFSMKLTYKGDTLVENVTKIY